MPEFNFTKEQRLILMLLCDVHRGPGEREFTPEDISLISHAVSNGQDWVIDWHMGMAFPDEVDSDEDVRFVANVLDMWTFIELGWQRFNDTEREKVRAAVPHLTDPRFIGFDGNNETAYMAIADTLINRMGRFTEFQGRSLNSHSPKCDRYREMLKPWDGIRATLGNSEMTTEKMISLLSRD